MTALDPTRPPIPGPIDRETFMHAQARQRRASWRLGAASGLAIALLGIPLSVLLSPLLLALGLIAYDVTGIFVHVPHPFVTLSNEAAHQGSSEVVHRLALATPAVVLLLVPGAIALVLCWLGVRRLFRNVGAGSQLLATARPVRPDALEERQLENLVEAVALAAGLPPPKVRILDSDGPNAGIAGKSWDDATVVVTAGLLDRLSRDETEGVVARLVAAVGNGDLARSRSLECFYATLALVEAALGLGTVPAAPKALRAALRLAIGRGEGAGAEQALFDVLNSPAQERRAGCVSAMLTPLVVTGAAFRFSRQAVGDLVVQPFLRRRWRRRVLLADATAVQLTRYPDGLTKALVSLGSVSTIPTGAQTAAPLLFAGPPVATTKGSMATENVVMTGFQPPIALRVSQLVKLGATPGLAATPPARRHASGPARVVVLLIFGPLIAALVVSFVAVMIAAVVASIGATMLIVVLYLGIPLALAHHFLVAAAR